MLQSSLQGRIHGVPRSKYDGTRPRVCVIYPVWVVHPTLLWLPTTEQNETVHCSIGSARSHASPPRGLSTVGLLAVFNLFELRIDHIVVGLARLGPTGIA